MNLPAFCIRRPAFTIVISLVLIIVGVIGFMHLPVRWIPNVNPPMVSISTSYPGANARIVEHDVTKVIEGALSGINGVESISSGSKQDYSGISIVFELGRDMNAAVEDVRAAVERVRGELPRDAENPIIAKADPDSEPFLYISFQDTHRSTRELSDYVDKYIVPPLETLDGVGGVIVYGKRVSAMQIKLDPNKMAGANVTVGEVAQLLKEQSTSIPSGRIRGVDRFYSVLTDTSIKTPQQFNDLIIRDDLNHTVRLKDIGLANIDVEDADFAFRINGNTGLAVAIIGQSNANPLDIEEKLKIAFAGLERALPPGMQAKIIYSQADYIRASIHSVYKSLFEAIIFVWLVILIFLGNLRATIIPLLTIPVCLISSFALLYFFGFSINTITLMAFVLAIGLVVDDAIVMLENISRYIEQGLSPFNAALKGSKEIVFPIIAMTLTLVAVYIPVAFTSGLLGVLFKEFTYTLAGAVLVSGVVALTLTPMMCARLLSARKQHGRYENIMTHALEHTQQYYKKILSTLLAKRAWVVLALCVIGLGGYGLYRSLPAELAPTEDRSEIDVHVSAPRNASYQYTDSYVKQLEQLYQTIPDVETFMTINYSAPHSYHILMLKPKDKRKQSLEQLLGELTAKSNKITGVRVNVFPPPPALAQFVGGKSGDRLGVTLKTSGDYESLQQAATSITDEVKKHPEFIHADSHLKWDSTEFQVNIDRDRAMDLKVTIPAITETISTLIAGRKIGKTDDANIYLKINDASLANPNIFYQLFVRSKDNKMIPLSSLLEVQEVTSPQSFQREGRMRADRVNVTLAPNVKLSDAVSILENIAKTKLPDNIQFEFMGEAKSFLESSGKTAITFLLALIFIYLVLVAQFESFVDPLVILLTVPFAMIGAILTLKIFGGTSNIYSNIGLITLIGLIAKHGILITEFANKQREMGASIQDAVIEAAILRLRPILMTTAAMALGAIPLAFASGAGAEARQQIGLVMSGGIVFGTFFSLIVVPVAYTYLAPWRRINTNVLDQEPEHATVL